MEYCCLDSRLLWLTVKNFDVAEHCINLSYGFLSLVEHFLVDDWSKDREASTPKDIAIMQGKTIIQEVVQESVPELFKTVEVNQLFLDCDWLYSLVLKGKDHCYNDNYYGDSDWYLFVLFSCGPNIIKCLQYVIWISINWVVQKCLRRSFKTT